jgi:hypothetical protein
MTKAADRVVKSLEGDRGIESDISLAISFSRRTIGDAKLTICRRLANRTD